ncbi:hypothetical protein HRI_002010500 [Hibiscus trionum]|uniref:Retrotransposon Copia-like N-terminal domain-containing protein n=1 Tax=Hibiscus trionum TaxID=183268 RepID=A0A9W7HUW5_HIBTR|nr:hypothetical protein HRI_002010500 [Hibiscus trionum]
MVSELGGASASGKPFKNKTISIRLDDSNYLLWRQQVSFAIESLALTSHVDGTIKIPPQYVLSQEGVKDTIMVSELGGASVLGKPFKNKTISIRLDDSNYLLWRQQVSFAIESLALTSHVDGTIKIPPQYVLSQ